MMPATKTRGGPKRLAEPWKCEEHEFESAWPPAIASHKLRLHAEGNGATPPPASRPPLARPDQDGACPRTPRLTSDGTAWTGIAADALYLHARVVMERLDSAVRDRKRELWSAAARELAALAKGLSVIAQAEEK